MCDDMDDFNFWNINLVGIWFIVLKWEWWGVLLCKYCKKGSLKNYVGWVRVVYFVIKN